MRSATQSETTLTSAVHNFATGHLNVLWQDGDRTLATHEDLTRAGGDGELVVMAEGVNLAAAATPARWPPLLRLASTLARYPALIFGALGARKTRVPNILITAFPDKRLHLRAFGSGVVSSLRKPFMAQEPPICLERTLAKRTGL